MKENHAISETIVIDEEGYEVLVLAVPIRKDETTVGVIYGTFTKKTLDSITYMLRTGHPSSDVLFAFILPSQSIRDFLFHGMIPLYRSRFILCRFCGVFQSRGKCRHRQGSASAQILCLPLHRDH